MSDECIPLTSSSIAGFELDATQRMVKIPISRMEGKDLDFSISLRDWRASIIMAGMYANINLFQNPDVMAKNAYAAADALEKVSKE